MLHLKVRQHVILALVDELLRLDRKSGYTQDYCNAAWSLAVANMLSVEIFSSILEQLQPPPGAELASDAVSSQELSQLYQALDFLQPLTTAAAALQLQEMVTRLGLRALPVERSAAALTASRRLCAALGHLGLAFTADVPLSGYQAHAVLQPRDGNLNSSGVGHQCFRLSQNQRLQVCILLVVSLHQSNACLEVNSAAISLVTTTQQITAMRNGSKLPPCCAAQKCLPAAMKQLSSMFAG